MPESKKQATRRDPLSDDFGALEEFLAFWDTHSTAGYECLMEDVDVRMGIRSSPRG